MRELVMRSSHLASPAAGLAASGKVNLVVEVLIPWETDFDETVAEKGAKDTHLVFAASQNESEESQPAVNFRGLAGEADDH